ncbi:HDL084Wp [Eremothecium sinecaudum]|uniref:HDL084Wp n=1 Tax=Eremothecium sinecaudum TaxID=45286 RepID=A0A0X8HSK1_9SACH|nr:HDL084Wp [Eremothecium sinecaudum]AMD20660.1 HDL084Wp [Eremothecium sinecaudum]
MADKEYFKQLEAQRRAFEAQFGVLEDMGYEDKTKQALDDSSISDVDEVSNPSDVSSSFYHDSDAESSLCEEEQETVALPAVKTRQPRVIKFNAPKDDYVLPSKEEQRLLKKGLIPSVQALKAKTLLSGKKSKSNPTADADEEAIEKENLHNDIELQRFLKESHLLSALGSAGSSSSGAELTLQTMDNIEYRDDQLHGKARSRTIEMRLREVAKTNGKGQKLEKVPMNVRKGMINKHVERIQKHEQEARDAGIVLSKVKKGQFRNIEATYKKRIEDRIGTSIKSKDRARENARHRERGFKIHSVGKSTRNGLVISQRDIAKVTGSNTRNPRGRRR